MGFLDKLMGRGKRAAGEAMDSPAMREEGHHQESAANASDRAETHEEMAQTERERAARETAEQERMNP